MIATLGSGTFFGEMSLVGQRMHNAFTEAVDECLLCVMSRTDLERLMRTHPEVAFRFVEASGHPLTEVEALEDMAFKSLPARLASLLLDLAPEAGSDREVSGYTHQDLAETLGTYRETVTQTLNEFRQEGLVELGRKHILILNPVALETLAET